MAIYDCFTFNNEIELLKVRLKTYSRYVDKFVLVELPVTQIGKSKPLYFKEHEDEFSEYLDKIIYVSPEYIPECEGPGDWTIECYQRNCILKGLEKCDLEDIVLISDLDEFPDVSIFTEPEKVMVSAKPFNKLSKKRLGFAYAFLNKKQVLKLLRGKLSLNEALEYTNISLNLKNCYYYLNCQSDGNILCSTIAKYKNMALPQVSRDYRKIDLVVNDAGHHFSYLGGEQKIIDKLNAIVEGNDGLMQEVRKNGSVADHVHYCMENAIDIYGRSTPENQFHFIEPEAVNLPNIDKLVKEFPNLFKL